MTIANFIRATVVPLVLTKESKKVAPFTKDQGIKDIAAELDLLILTRNKSHFRGAAKSCGGVAVIAETNAELIDRLVKEVLTLDPSVLYKAYTTASRREVTVFPGDGGQPLRHRRR